MASIIQIGEKFRVQVRRAGQPTLTKTFPNKETPCKTLADAKEAATKWGILEEAKIISGVTVGMTGKVGITLAHTIDRYLEAKPKLSRTGVHILLAWKSALGKKLLEKLTEDDIVSLIDKKHFSKVAGMMYFSFISSVLKKAKIGWKYHVPEILVKARDQLKELELTGQSVKRERRPTDMEIDALLTYQSNSEIPLADIIRFAISSAMRQNEIMKIVRTKYDKKNKTVNLKRKHPTNPENYKDVPLLDESISILDRQVEKEADDRFFPYDPRTVAQLFRRACKELKIIDLHFHDLRHEGTSRLFEMGYQIQEVCLFTGHETWEMLKRYTQLKAKNVRRLDTAKIEPENIANGTVEMDAETLKQFKQFQVMMAMMKKTETA